MPEDKNKPRREREDKPRILWLEVLFPNQFIDVPGQLVPVWSKRDLRAKLAECEECGWPVWQCGDVAYVFATEEGDEE